MESARALAPYQFLDHFHHRYFFYDPACAFVMTIVVVVLMALIVFVLLHATNLDIKQHYGGEERLFCLFMIDIKY